ncbi:PAS domain S-box protein [Chitinivorax sp. PXF-14]|uniref:bifunctional diguanylate cyclase/phosphodiesterase n=1 Tax=Chitinivorax sp. PXF-14 TaxID=3230488 RepID=UPI0034678B22
MGGPMGRDRFAVPGGHVLHALVLLIVLLGAAEFGYLFRYGEANIPLLWPPAGVALAALLIGGIRLWWVVALASLVSGLLHGDNWLTGLCLSLGSSLGAALSAHLLRMHTSAGSELKSLRDVISMILVGALFNASVSACFGALGFYLPHMLSLGSLNEVWLMWWLAEVVGILLTMPLVLALLDRRLNLLWKRRWGELALLATLTTAISAVVFGNAWLQTSQNLAFQFVIFPLIVWGAIRFGYVGTGIVAFLASVIAASTMLVHGVAPATTHIGTTFFLFGFMSVMASAGMILSASIEERRSTLEVLDENRKQIQSVLNNLPTLFYIKDVNGRYSIVNRAFANLFGMSVRDLIGKTEQDLFSTAEAKRFLDNEHAVRQTRKNIQFEESFELFGQQHTYLVNKFPVYDRDGKITGICANGIDISERKRTESEFVAAQARFRALVESPLAGICIIQNDLLVYSNPELAAMLGYRPEELSGKPFYPFVLPADWALLKSQIDSDQYRRTQNLRTRLRIRPRTGGPITVELHTRHFEFNGQTAVIGLLLDISQQLQTEYKLGLFAKVFESATDAICITDADERIVAVNNAFSRVTGYRQDEALGKELRDLSGDISPKSQSDLRASILQDGYWQGELIGRHRDGHTYPAWISVSALRSDAGHTSNLVTVFSDITSLKEAESARLEAERKFRALVELSLVGFYIVQDGVLQYVNPTLAEAVGYTQDEMVGMNVAQVTAQEDLPVLIENHRKRASGEVESVRYTYRARHRDGRYVDVEAHGRGFEFNGRPAIIGLLMDISDRVKQERELRLAAKVFDNATEGILITDAHAEIIAVNPAFSKITGYPVDEAVGKVSRMFRTGPNLKDINRDMLMSLEVGGFWQGELLDCRKNGDSYPAWLSISAVRDAQGSITNYVGVFSDITSRKEAEERLYFLANHDSLTRLPNRSLLHERLAQSLARAREFNQALAVLFIDLDRFKNINDTLGHHSGDKLLQAVAKRLQGCVKEYDLIARLGGDEFTVVLENVPDAQHVAAIAERILHALGQPFVLEAQELFVTASIGISMFPSDGQDALSLLKNADIAMYRSKELGKNTYQFFASEMNALAFEHLVMENSLRYALERGEFELHYQAQVELLQHRIIGMEALLRWRHPELGLVSPDRFIPLAEESGMIVPIGEWVLTTACRQAKAWQDAGYPPLRMAINLSARQFRPEHLVRVVRQALNDSGLEPNWLELEITESMIMRNAEEAVQIMVELKEMGVQLSIDDFGTGYSSLNNLKHFPIHNLKIDGSFVEGIPTDADDMAITEVIISMAKKLGLKVIAEGVERADQLEFLREHGCDLVQGYMFSRPKPAADVELLFSALGIYQEQSQNVLPLVVKPQSLEIV